MSGYESYFCDNGYDATEEGQCPHKPGTPDWKLWQADFIQGRQVRTRAAEMEKIEGRAADLGFTLHQPRWDPFGPSTSAFEWTLTPKQRACADLMEELEYGPRPPVVTTGRTTVSCSVDVVSWSVDVATVNISASIILDDLIKPSAFQHIVSAPSDLGFDLVMWSDMTASDATGYSSGTKAAEKAPKTRHPGKRRVRAPQVQASCHHGNQKGACRACWR